MNQSADLIQSQRNNDYRTLRQRLTINVLDSNGNSRPIGTTTTSDGTFGFTWTPDIPGDFKITANFEGSNAYYPSSATTYVHASDSPTPAPTATPQSGLATTADLLTYMAAGVVAIIIAIAIVGLLILRKHA